MGETQNSRIAIIDRFGPFQWEGNDFVRKTERRLLHNRQMGYFAEVPCPMGGDRSGRILKSIADFIINMFVDIPTGNIPTKVLLIKRTRNKRQTLLCIIYVRDNLTPLSDQDMINILKYLHGQKVLVQSRHNPRPQNLIERIRNPIKKDPRSIRELKKLYPNLLENSVLLNLSEVQQKAEQCCNGGWKAFSTISTRR